MPLGYDVFEVDGRLEIQADDEIGVYDSDHDAIVACVNDTLQGNSKSAELLLRVLTQFEEDES